MSDESSLQFAKRVAIAIAILIGGMAALALLVGAPAVGASLIFDARAYPVPLWQKFLLAFVLLAEAVMGVKGLAEWFGPRSEPFLRHTFPRGIHAYFPRAIQAVLAAIALAGLVAAFSSDARDRREGVITAAVCAVAILAVGRARARLHAR